jgi:hypothetical protein
MAEPLNIAVQESAQPTNKVAASTNASGSVAAVVAGVMAAYGGDAIREVMGAVATTHPDGTNLVVMLVTGIAAFYATKLGGRAAAYNVLDKPNVPLVAASPTPPKGA